MNSEEREVLRLLCRFNSGYLLYTEEKRKLCAFAESGPGECGTWTCTCGYGNTSIASCFACEKPRPIDWQHAAQRLGEELMSDKGGPLHYYELPPREWLKWAMEQTGLQRCKPAPTVKELELAMRLAMCAEGSGIIDGANICARVAFEMMGGKP